MSKITIPTEEFEPVSAAILGAVDGIPKEYRGELNSFKSNYNGEDFIVCSLEKPMVRSFSRLVRRKFAGYVSVSLDGMNSVTTGILYRDRIEDQAELIDTKSTFGAITEPNEFAQIVKSADFTQNLDLDTGMDPTEAENVKQMHSPVIAMAYEILDKEGLNRPVMSKIGSNKAITVASVDIEAEIKLHITRRLADREFPEILAISTEELSIDGDPLEKTYIFTSDGFIQLIHTGLAGRKIIDGKKDFLLISDEDLERMYKIFKSRL